MSGYPDRRHAGEEHGGDEKTCPLCVAPPDVRAATKPASTVLCEAVVAEFPTHVQWCMEAATGSVDCDDAWCQDEEHAHWACPEHGGQPPAKRDPSAAGS